MYIQGINRVLNLRSLGGKCMWVYSDLFTYEDIKRTHEDINKTPIHEIMAQKH